MYPLTADHPRLRDMIDITRIFDSSRTRLLFYLTPIDYQTGNRLVGEAFSRRLRENSAVIRALLAAENVLAPDLTFSLGWEAFGWRGDGQVPGGNKIPDEHLAEAGRRYVATQVADSLKGILEPDWIEGVLAR
jgi:hypothetical protein